MSQCSAMLNGWKRCGRSAVRDGLCSVHHPSQEKTYARATATWRKTAGALWRPR